MKKTLLTIALLLTASVSAAAFNAFQIASGTPSIGFIPVSTSLTGPATWMSTSSLGFSGGGGSTTTISGVTCGACTFATGTATGIGLNISTSSNTFTFTPTVLSGYGIPTTANITAWNAASASTTALTPAYIRGLFSNTATGLTYTSATGVTSLTGGYTIPVTTDVTNWNTFYTTPSTRITAGANCSWASNTFNCTGGSGGGATTTINGFSGPTFTFATTTGFLITGLGSTLTFGAASGYAIPTIASTTPWNNNLPTASTSENIFGMEYMAAFHNKMYAGGTPVISLSGDSTTQGTAITDPNYLLQNLLKKISNNNYKNATFYNDGVASASTSQWASTYVYNQIAHTPDLYVVRWGINDPFYGGSTTTFNTALRSGLATIRATSSVSSSSCILMTPNSTNDTPNGRDRAWYIAINPLVRQAARDYQCAFIDTFAYFQDSINANIWMDNPYGDGRHIHPLEMENLWIAGKMAELMYPPYLKNLVGGNNFENLTFTNFAPATSTLPTGFPMGLAFSRSSGTDWTADGYDGMVTTLKSVDGVSLQFNNAYAAKGLAWRTGSASAWNGWQFPITSDKTGNIDGVLNYKFSGNLGTLGNVGVGTTTPSEKLSIIGIAPVIRIEDGGYNNAGFLGAVSDYLQFGGNRNPSTGAITNTGKAASALTLYSGAGSGFIQFFTTNTNNAVPAQKLRINGVMGIPANSGAMTTGVYFGDVANVSLNVGAYDDFTNGYAWLSAGYSNSSGVHYPIALNQNGGNVGIGTSTPSASLTVVGSSTITSLNAASCDVMATVTGGLYCGTNGSGGSGSIGSAGTIQFASSTAGSFDSNSLFFFNTSTARLAVGTSTAINTLTLAGAGTTGLRNYSSTSSISFYESTTAGNLQMGTFNAGQILMYTANSFRLGIDELGKVGIGGLPSTAYGKLRLTGVSTSTNRGTNGAYLTVDNANVVADDGTGGAITHANTVTFFGSNFSASTASTYANASTLYIGGAPTASTNVTITSPWALYVNAGNARFGGGISAQSWIQFGTTNNIIYDSNANEILEFSRTASAVNNLSIINSITGTGPTLAATGTDANINLLFATKGTGMVGIATTTPFKMLTVAGEAYVSATTTVGGLQVSAPATGTSTAYIYSKQSGFGGAIIMEDKGGGACTMLTTSAGVVSASVVTCPTEI